MVTPKNSLNCIPKNKPKPDPNCEVPRKPIYLNLTFKGHQPLNDAHYKLKSALRRTYPPAQLRLIPSTRGINLDKGQRSQLENSASYVIYQFTCSCGDIYVGRTDRQLTQRMSVHIPKWLKSSMLSGSPKHQPSNRNPSSSIAKHISETGHTVDPISPFQPLLRNLNSKLLAFSEAMLIRLRNPPLCSQKVLTQSIHLPWSWLYNSFVFLFQLEIHHLSVKLEVENWLEHWRAVSFCLELFSSAHQRSLVGTESATSLLESQSLTAVLFFIDNCTEILILLTVLTQTSK